MRNEELIRKADMSLSDLASNGGLLQPEEAATFIRTLLVQPTILAQSRRVIMRSPKRNINKIGFGSRILRPASQGAIGSRALDAADRSAPTTSQITLETDEVIAEVDLPYEVIEDNIERGNLNLAGPNASHRPVSGGIKDTIIALIAERCALDLEELALLGDTGHGSDTYLQLTDGYLKLATANEVAVGGAVSRAMFKNGVKAMPDQYLRNRNALKHFISHDQETEYRDLMAARETTLGDTSVTANNPIYAFGSRVEPASLMPEAQGLFTNPQNLIFGIQRDVSFEVDKDIRDRVFIIVVTARVAFQIEEVNAVVKYTGIT